jgi:hypothetical protein
MSQNEKEVVSAKDLEVKVESSTKKFDHPAYKSYMNFIKVEKQKKKTEAVNIALKSPLTDEGQQIDPERKITSEVVQSFEYKAPIDYLRRFTSNSTYFTIPIIGTGSVASIGGGTFATGASIATGSLINLSDRVGTRINWTRDYPEDCGYDVVSEQTRIAGEAFYNNIRLTVQNYATGGNAATNFFYTGAAGAQCTIVASGSTGITLANFKAFSLSPLETGGINTLSLLNLLAPAGASSSSNTFKCRYLDSFSTRSVFSTRGAEAFV